MDNIKAYLLKPWLIVAALLSVILGNILEEMFAVPLRNAFNISNEFLNAFVKDYLLPISIASAPFIFFLVWLDRRIDKASSLLESSFRPNSPQTAPSSVTAAPSVSSQNSSLIQRLGEVGIVEVTDALQGTKYTPQECRHTKRSLAFLGILGSKWVNDKNYETFLGRMDATDGTVKFLLINPDGRGYQRLSDVREETINPDSLEKFYALQQRYSVLRVKLYDDLPSFRMIFIDGKELAVSTYKLDKEGHFKSRFGWDNPHLVLDANSPWSLRPIRTILPEALESIRRFAGPHPQETE